MMPKITPNKIVTKLGIEMVTVMIGMDTGTDMDMIGMDTEMDMVMDVTDIENWVKGKKPGIAMITGMVNMGIEMVIIRTDTEMDMVMDGTDIDMGVKGKKT